LGKNSSNPPGREAAHKFDSPAFDG
jgi:hypothetical protein